jgi:methyl-accepting chemotaxis protein
LKAQEEELRQNLEEFQATQEDFHRVQEELKKKNTEIEEKMTAFEESEIGMVELKISGTILSANNYFLSITGYQENEVLGKHYKMFFSPDFLETSECQDLWYNMRSGDLSAEQYPRIRKDGSETQLRNSYKAVCDADGFPYKILCICFNLTE